MAKPPRIVVIGNAVADVVARTVDEVPRTGSLHPETVRYFPGGCANNVAMGLARLGTAVTLAASIGYDVFGDALLAHWRDVGIDTGSVARQPSEPTGVTIVLVDSTGERRFISTPAANRLLGPEHLPYAALDECFAVHIAGFFTVPGLEGGALIPFLEAARERGVMTVLDPVGGSARERREELLRLLPYLDLVLVNEDEGEKVTGARKPDAVARALMERGASSVIVKLGSRGSHVYGSFGDSALRPFRCKTVDSTGAGDAFVAALLASLARGEDFRAAARWASAAGAANTEALGAMGEWRGWEDLETVMAREQRSNAL